MTAYWNQLSHAEILSMHGVELDAYHDDDYEPCHLNSEDEEPLEHYCSMLCADCVM